jgi:hypothetical protein
VTVLVSVLTTISLALALATVPRSIVIVSGVAAGGPCGDALDGALVSMLPALDPRLHAATVSSAVKAMSARDES